MLWAILIIVILISIIVFDSLSYPSLHDIFFRIQDELRIIQIGGHIGPLWYGGRDPVYRFIFDDRRHTHAIIVEPIKQHFEQLKKNYANVRNPQRIHFENAAIFSDPSVSSIHMTVPTSKWCGLHASTTASLKQEHVEKHGQLQNARVEMVPSMTFDELLAKYTSFDCNCLIIDVEGYEVELLTSIPWSSSFKPNILQFENKHIKKSKNVDLQSFLEQHGYVKMHQGSLDVIYIHERYMQRWLEQIEYKADAKLTPLNSVIYTISSITMIYAIYTYFSRVVAYILAVALLLIAFIKMLPAEIDEFLHTKMIHIPQWIKCWVNINCGDHCQLRDSNNWESQTNADIDFYSLGHIVLWCFITYMEVKVTFVEVAGVSIVWESFEVFMGCLGFPMHGRVTDILINLCGFFIGTSLRGKQQKKKV